MKKYLLMLAMLSLIITMHSCEKNELVVEEEEEEMMEVKDELTKVTKGKLQSTSSYSVSGEVFIAEDGDKKYYLGTGDDFKCSFPTGSVTMCLSSKAQLDLSSSDSHIRVGALNTNGKNLLNLANGKPAANMIYVIVWCAPARIQFANAKLE